jgi:hypothetical protein
MSVEENLYRAPEAPVVDRPAYQPRPFHVFLAGASCIGGSVPFFLMTLAVCVGFVRHFLEFGWPGMFATWSDYWVLGSGVGFAACAISLVMAGRAFLARRGPQGRRILLLFGAAFLGLVALFATLP